MIITTEWNGLVWLHYVHKSVLEAICDQGEYRKMEEWEMCP